MTPLGHQTAAAVRRLWLDQPTLLHRADLQPLLASHRALVSLCLHVESNSKDIFSSSHADFTIWEHHNSPDTIFSSILKQSLNKASTQAFQQRSPLPLMKEHHSRTL